MSAPKQRPALRICEDMAFQRRTWLVERTGWIVLGVILIVALLGYFGGAGPAASTQTASEDGNLSMRYERFLRLRTPTQLRIEARSTGQTLRQWLEHEYFESIELTGVAS